MVLLNRLFSSIHKIIIVAYSSISAYIFSEQKIFVAISTQKMLAKWREERRDVYLAMGFASLNDKNNEQILRVRLRKLFSEALLSYQYIVLVPRRCLNLWKVMYDNTWDDFEVKWVTDIGMLSYADDVANVYLEKGHFPRILYVDDVLIHGQSLNRRIRRFANLVISSLRNNSSIELDYDAVLHALIDVIDIHVLFRNNSKLLMSRDLSYRVSSLETYSKDVLQQASLEITRFLANRSEITNTSYVLSSFSKVFYGLEASSWTRLEVPYYTDVIPDSNNNSNNNFEKMSLWLNDSVVSYGCYPVVRSHKKETENGELYQYIPYILHPSINGEECAALLTSLNCIVNRKVRNNEMYSLQHASMSGLSDLFTALQTLSTTNSRVPIELTSHALEMFLSQIVLTCFSSEMCKEKIVFTDINTDVAKILLNYDRILSKNAILAFCNLDWTLSDLQEVCSVFSSSEKFYFDASCFENKKSLSSANTDVLFHNVFNQMLACGCLHNLLQESNVLRNQHYALSSREYSLSIAEDSPFYLDQRNYDLYQYIADCSKHIEIHSREDVQCVIAALFSLMDLGLFSLRLIVTASSAPTMHQINQSMRHTEISLCALEYLLKPIWEDLKAIALLCHEKNISIKHFLLPHIEKLVSQHINDTCQIKPMWLLAEVIQELDNNDRLYTCIFQW